MGNMRSLNHLIPNLTYCSSDFRNPCWIKTKRASYLDGWIKDGGCMMRSHVRTGCVSWCWSSDPDHVTRAISAHCSSSNIGQCQARPVGSPTVSPHTFSGLSHNTHYKTSREIQKIKRETFHFKVSCRITCAGGKITSSGGQWRAWCRLELGSVGSPHHRAKEVRGRDHRGQEDQEIRSHETRGWQGPGAVRGWGLVSGPEPGSGLSHHRSRSRSQWPGARDPGPGLASRAQPLLPTPVSQDTKYSRFFSQVCFEVSLSQGLPTPIHHTSQYVIYRATREEDTFILSWFQL